MQHFVHGPPAQRSDGCAQQPRRCGICKADQSVAIHSANTVGNRIQQHLLLAVKYLGASLFLRTRQQLSQRSRCSLNRRHRIAVFVQTKLTVELEHRKNAVPHAHRRRPAGSHLLAQCRLNSRARWFSVQLGDPHRARIPPCAPHEFVAARKPQSHAFLDQGLCVTARCAPCRRKYKLVQLSIDIPLDRQVPSLRYAKRLKDAHRGGFGRRILSNNLAHNKLQRKPMFALLLVGNVPQQAAD